MKITLTHNVYGKIVYDENAWSGKRTISVNGKVLTKRKGNIYCDPAPQSSITVVLKGNSLFGLRLSINGEAPLSIIPAPTWYEIVLFSLIACVGLVLGNFPHTPLIGGAIGGGISGAMGVFALYALKPIHKIGAKLLVGLALLGATFLLCYIAALVFVAALA